VTLPASAIQVPEPQHPLLKAVFTHTTASERVTIEYGNSVEQFVEDNAHAAVWLGECVGEPWLPTLSKMLDNSNHPIGNAVSEFRAAVVHTLLQGRRISDVLKNIRLFVAELKLLTLNALALERLVVNEQRPITVLFEQAVATPVYSTTIQLLSLANNNADCRYNTALQACMAFEPIDFGCKAGLNFEPASLMAAVAALNKLHESVSATEKGLWIIQACTQIVEACAGEEVGADDLVPLLAYCTVRAKPRDMPTQLCYVEQMMGSHHDDGELCYFLTTMHVVVAYLTSLTP